MALELRDGVLSRFGRARPHVPGTPEIVSVARTADYCKTPSLARRCSGGFSDDACRGLIDAPRGGRPSGCTHNWFQSRTQATNRAPAHTSRRLPPRRLRPLHGSAGRRPGPAFGKGGLPLRSSFKHPQDKTHPTSNVRSLGMHPLVLWLGCIFGASRGVSTEGRRRGS